MSAVDRLDQIETKARAHSAAYEQMLKIGEGLAVAHPGMVDDMSRWDDSTGNDHADTVLTMVAGVRAVLDLHRPDIHRDENFVCIGCGETYPCATVRAVEDALGGDDR